MKIEWILFAALALYLVAAVILVDDYGMNIDSQKNFREGEMHLRFLFTGQADREVLQWQMHGAYVFMAADAAKRLLHDTLRLYDATAARHVVGPLLAVFFLICLFYFVRRHWSGLDGLVAVLVLLTFPCFWGHTFNNLKDVPLLVFFSLSIMSFVEWIDTRRLKFFYGFFAFWGFAIAIKTYALFVAPVLVLWLLVRPKDREAGERFPRPDSIVHVFAAPAVTLAVVCALFAPAFWGIEDKMSFLPFWRDRLKEITWGKSSPLNAYSLVQVFFRTPLLVLISALIGLFAAVRGFRASRLNSLLVVWLFTPLAIPCLPRTLIYHNGMRLFMVFLVPFCILSAIGIGRSAGFLGARLGRSGKAVFAAVASLVIGASLWGVVSTHPYQTTFFNALAGGLKGAQEKHIPDAVDYWLNSYREAERWIDRYGAADATVIALYAAGTPFNFHTDLVRDALERPDFRTYRFPGLPMRNGKVVVPQNSYVILAPFDYLGQSLSVLERSGEFRKVHTISRQGGVICAIYRKPRANESIR